MTLWPSRIVVAMVLVAGGVAPAGESLLVQVLRAFRLGDRELTGQESFRDLRAKLDAAIEKLR